MGKFVKVAGKKKMTANNKKGNMNQFMYGKKKR
jgi:hypothetical protein